VENDKQKGLRQRTLSDVNSEKVPLKRTEAALLSELISNCRRSDRELAKAIGVSQPTVSRMIKRLESDGIVNEYTMIPDFKKLGYTLCALIFLRLKDLPPGGIEAVKRAVKESLNESRFIIILLERGLGLSRDAVMVCLYKDYTSYAEHKNVIREFPYIESSDVDSFLIDLCDKVHYRYLSFASVAKDLLASYAEKE
jgi:DNA-binding Lrp family transcriptional regulator